jgi:DNA modification methylase
VISTGDNWTLHLGDCIEGMRGLADDSVDVTITDPPYDEHTHKAGRRGHTDYREGFSSNGATFNRARELGFDAITKPQMAATACELARLTKRWTLVFCSLEMIADWSAALVAAGLQYVRTCVWHKLGSTPQFTGDRPAAAVEAIVLCHRPGRKRWNGGGKHGYYAHPIVLNRPGGMEVRCHTTQKPLPLMVDLVRDFSNPGELVLDAYTGSATTAIAATQSNRRFLGWELSPDYYEIACRRLRGDEAKPNPAQPGLFDIQPAVKASYELDAIGGSYVGADRTQTASFRNAKAKP